MMRLGLGAFILLVIHSFYVCSIAQYNASTLNKTLAWAEEFNVLGPVNQSTWNYNLGTQLPDGPEMWGTGEVEHYTDSPENSYVIDDPWSKQTGAGRYLRITAMYSDPVQDYSGFYGTLAKAWNYQNLNAGIFFLMLYVQICVLRAIHAAATHIFPSLSLGGKVVDMGYWVIDVAAGTTLLGLVAVLSLFGIMEKIQAALLFNASFVKSSRDAKATRSLAKVLDHTSKPQQQDPTQVMRELQKAAIAVAPTPDGALKQRSTFKSFLLR